MMSGLKESVVASQCVKDLRESSHLLAKNGWPVSADVCKYAADRMERMEELIVSMQDDIKENETERENS